MIDLANFVILVQLLIRNFEYSKIKEKIKKKFTILILLTPKFQKINNSLFNSYLAITYEKLKKKAKGRILLIILGKFKSV